jgi:hypothetical protein
MKGTSSFYVAFLQIRQIYPQLNNFEQLIEVKTIKCHPKMKKKIRKINRSNIID